LIDAYRSHGLTLEAFAGERYHRLRRVEALQQAGWLDAQLRWLGTASVIQNRLAGPGDSGPGERSVQVVRTHAIADI
jgi:hypothetical protein